MGVVEVMRTWVENEGEGKGEGKGKRYPGRITGKGREGENHTYSPLPPSIFRKQKGSRK